MPLRTYAERRQAGLDILSAMVGKPERAQKMAEILERDYGALGSFAVNFAFGDIWDRPGLPKRDRSLATLSSLVCQGRDRELRFHARAALNLGVTQQDITELILHLCPYVGFPTAIDAMGVVNEVFDKLNHSASSSTHEPALRESAPPVDDAERAAAGAEMFRSITGWELPYEEGDDLAETAGWFLELPVKWAFGEIWTRSQLPRRDRSLILVAALITLGKPEELRVHIPAARTHGMTETELNELLVHMIPYTGLPAVADALRVLRATLKSDPATVSDIIGET